MPKIGVLALQGAFAAHIAALARVGVKACEVRHTGELDGLDGLIIPGGESTTLLNLMQDEPWFDRLREFHREGGALFGTCAGAILLSREVRGPEQPGLGLLDAVIERNAYGRQRESFEERLALPIAVGSMEAVFIRAPRFRSLGPGVEVLARFGDDAVLVRQGRVLAAAFHPELAADDRLHRYFVEMAAGERRFTRTGSEVAATS
jgi:5'-phosphate synthase pdxT subunit